MKSHSMDLCNLPNKFLKNSDFLILQSQVSYILSQILSNVKFMIAKWLNWFLEKIKKMFGHLKKKVQEEFKFQEQLEDHYIKALYCFLETYIMIREKVSHFYS